MLRSFSVFPQAITHAFYPGNPKSAPLLISGPRSCCMLQREYIRNHIDALLRLSRNVKDRAVSAELREMADEFRIILSVTDISELAAELSEPVPLAGSDPHRQFGAARSPV
jgi:hypothetical protein